MEKKRKKQQEKFYPAALTVAPSSSGGSDGIQADLRTFNGFGVYGCTTITGVISRNPAALFSIETLSPETVASQIDAVMSAVDIKFVKCGMLFNAGIIDVLAAAVEKYQLQLICDPVLFSSENQAVFTPAELELFKSKLMKHSAWLTPGIAEAELLLGKKISSQDEQINAAKELHKLSGGAVVLKGTPNGSNSGKILSRITDVVCVNGEICTVSTLKADIPKAAAHGAGCTYSAALTAALTLEMPYQEAVCAAKAFVMGSLVENVRIGRNLTVMYPPVNDYMGSVRFEEMDVK